MSPRMLIVMWCGQDAGCLADVSLPKIDTDLTRRSHIAGSDCHHACYVETVQDNSQASVCAGRC